MPKKKRLVLIAAILIALAAGSQYGYTLSALCIGLLAVMLGGLRGIRYALAHVGVSKLAARSQRYVNSTRIAALKAAEKPGEPFTFVVLGDNRSTFTIAPVIHEQAKREHPDVIFNTGDLVRFGTAREFVKRYLPLLAIADPVPVIGIPGNHDRGARNDFAAFRAVHGEDRFSFDYGPCRFVGVNNGKRARMEADDIAFLHRELSKSPIPYKFVFIHIPPRYFEDGTVLVAKRRGFKRQEKEFRALMSDQQVTEVFMGHIHGYVSKEIDGVRYTLTAGAGAPLSKRLPEEARVYNYVRVRVTPAGLERHVVRYLDGKWVTGE